MPKLFTTLILMLTVVIGGTGVSYAGDRSLIKPLDNQITIGNIDYDNATTTISLTLIYKKKLQKKLRLAFRYSLKSQKNLELF